MLFGVHQTETNKLSGSLYLDEVSGFAFSILVDYLTACVPMKMIRKQTNHVLEVSAVILKGRKVCMQEECPAKCVLVFQVAILRIKHLTYTFILMLC